MKKLKFNSKWSKTIDLDKITANGLMYLKKGILISTLETSRMKRRATLRMKIIITKILSMKTK